MSTEPAGPHAGARPAAPPLPFELDEIERRRGIGPDEFRRDYLEPGRPVIIEDVARDWARRFTFEQIRADYGGRRVWATENYLDRPKPLDREVTVAEVIDCALRGSLELRFRNFLDELPELAETHRRDPFHRRLLTDARPVRHIVWITPAQNQSTFHHDNSFDNFNLQVCGAKRWLLVAPSEYRRLAPIYFHRSPIDPYAPDLRAYPQYAGVRPLVGTVGEGEIIFVPRFWWHCVRGLDPCININTFAQHGGSRATWRGTRALPLVPRLALSYAAHRPALGFSKTEQGMSAVLHWAVKKALWRKGGGTDASPRSRPA